MVGKSSQKKPEKFNQNIGIRLLNILLIVAVIIAVFGLIEDFKNTLDSGEVDLRNRVVAARLLIKGIDPYFFKWHQGMSDLFLDPLDYPSWPVSRATIPPTVLMIHAIIANLSYMNQKIIWFGLQWGLLLFTLAIFAKSANSNIKSKLILINGLLFFSGSYFWRLHVERGQIYIVYVFLLTCAYWLAQKSFKYSALLSGFLIGFTASLRLPVVVMLIPMLIYKQWKILIGTIVGLLSGLFFSFTFAGISSWKTYFAAMKVYEKIHSGLIQFNGSANDSNIRYPQQIEGMSNMATVIDLKVDDTSFQYMFQQLGIKLYPNILYLLLCITLLAIAFFLYKNRIDNNSINLLFLSGILMLLVGEHFLPAIRQNYNNIQWLFPLSLIIIITEPLSFLLSNLNVILLVSLFFNIGFNSMLQSAFINDITMMLYTLIVLLFIATRNNKITKFI